MSRKREDDNWQMFEELKPLIPWLKPEGVVLEFEHRVIQLYHQNSALSVLFIVPKTR